MKKYSVDSIETFGLVDGPGIRTVIFFNGCKLRCKFCHNPETWTFKEKNYSLQEIVDKVIRSKPYFKNNGGVTLSGGEPLLQNNLLELVQALKKEKIHIALDTAGVADNYEEILKYIDLVILDIKAYKPEDYQEMTGQNIDSYNNFLNECQKQNKKLWLRQVIVPGINDNDEYIEGLKQYISKIKNVDKIELLPYHSMAKEKYRKLGIKYILENTPDMDINKCKEFENKLKSSFLN